MTPFRILVADDNEDHLFFITRALNSLEDAAFDIEAVRDGEQALDFVHQRGDYVGRSRPHLILLDLRMPRKDGLEVLRELKSHDRLRSIPISVLTSSDRPEDVEASYNLGANSYLRKSTSPSGIRDQLASVSRYWTGTAVLPEPPA